MNLEIRHSHLHLLQVIVVLLHVLLLLLLLLLLMMMVLLLLHVPVLGVHRHRGSARIVYRLLLMMLQV